MDENAGDNYFDWWFRSAIQTDISRSSDDMHLTDDTNCTTVTASNVSLELLQHESQNSVNAADQDNNTMTSMISTSSLVNNFNNVTFKSNSFFSNEMQTVNSNSIDENEDLSYASYSIDSANGNNPFGQSITDIPVNNNGDSCVHSQENENVYKLTRKRKINKGLWIDEKAKKARNFGTEGMGRNGNIKKKVMGTGCDSNKCRLHCHDKVSSEERLASFTQFWDLGNKQSQWQCISNWMQDNEKTNGSIEHIYTLPNKNKEKIRVCKKMFLNTLDITRSWIKTVVEKKVSTNNTQVLQPDQRGKHKNKANKIPETLKNSARDDINSYPLMDSHYCRANTSRKYLEEGLSVAGMYRQYVIKMNDLNMEYVSSSMYYEIFNTEFNYGFYQPKKDRCEQCENYKNLSESDKLIQQKIHEDHIENKILARESMQTAKKMSKDNNLICCINFDMQKILTTPRVDIGPMYYMSKLCIWNFTIFNMATCEGECNIWNETIGCRGSDEIASFLWKYIKNKSQDGTKEFFLFSDNCGGQNKNKIVFSMYVKAANQFNVAITHRFLQVGHTQCDGDSMHARIEKFTSKKSVYTQEEWCNLIKECKVHKPYIVNEILQQDIVNFRDLSGNFNWNLIRISNIKEINVQPRKQCVSIKYDFREDEEKVKIFKKQVSFKNIIEYSLNEVYNNKICLSDRKKKDLQKMISQGFIPDKYHLFYENIMND